MVFGLSFGSLFIFAFFIEPPNAFIFVLLAIDLLIMFASAIGYLIAITLRDIFARGGKPWRFSVRTVLIVMTEIALAMGMLAWLMRR
jgi:hypothetical protein